MTKVRPWIEGEPSYQAKMAVLRMYERKIAKLRDRPGVVRYLRMRRAAVLADINWGIGDE